MPLDLFSEIAIRGMRARNRLMMAPMTQNSATETGEATDWHMVHYGSRAVGGCGMVLMEDTAVSSEGRVSSRSLCLHTDAHADSLRPVVRFCQENGAKVGIQLAHAGRKAWRDQRLHYSHRVSVCDVAFGPDWGRPATLREPEVERIVEDFRRAAGFALTAGFDFLEIHAAHGYLIHQFLSPLTNQRTDKYGGSADRRERFLTEVLSAVRSVWPDERPLFCRLPAKDGHPEGLKDADMIALARTVNGLGVDVIDVAASNVSSDCAVVMPKDMLEGCAMIRKETALATTTAGVKSVGEADTLIDGGMLDFVVMGRQLLANPYWALANAEVVHQEKLVPKQYMLAVSK